MTTFERIRELVNEHTGIEKSEITPAATLAGDLAMDELDIVEVVMNVEEEFGIEIDDEVADDFITIKDLTSHVDLLMKDRTKSAQENFPPKAR